MAIENLINIMPPPKVPIETRGVTWAHIENSISTALPSDYKTFVEKYGSGRINKFIWIFNPFSERRNINLINQISIQLDALKTLAQDFGEPHPFPLFPESGGLFPLGMTDNGDVIHWLTKGRPIDWKIVVNEARSPTYEQFNSNLVLFLEKILTRSSQCRLFPQNFPEGAPSFEAK